MANANRHIDSFGPKLVFETYSETATHPGPVSYTMTSSTDDQHKYQQGLYESGMTRFYSDGSIQIESAAKKTEDQDCERERIRPNHQSIQRH